MKRSLHSRNRSILFLALALSLLLTPAAQAVQSTFQILMDFDPGAGSGCSVVTAAGNVPGVDRIEVVTVDTLGAGSAQVSLVQTQSCTVPPSTFSAPAAIAGVPATPYTVGVGNGTGGLNVIEVAYPLALSSNPGGSEVRVAVTGSDGGVLSDAVIVTTPGGVQPIVIPLLGLAEVPTLGEVGLFALAFVLAAAALVVLRRKRTATAFLVAFLLFGLSGLAFAAASDLNGTTTAEWGTPLATDPTGLPDPPGADIGAFFGMKDAPSGRLYFRIDSTLLFNQAPVANDQAPNGSEDTPLNLTLTGSDPDGDSLTFTIVDQPDHGTLGAFSNVTPTSVDVTYTPTPDYNGPDSFTFQVADGNGGTDIGTVTITLTGDDDAPTAVDDAATVAEDSGATPVTVLANDTDVDGGPISISAVTQPANGTVVITGGGTGLTYAPNANYCNQPPGTTLDTFTYTLAPGGDTATVTMTVTCGDDAPVAVADAATVAEDSGATPVAVLANDTDLDGGPISVASVTQPANGTVVITGGGTGLTYAPNANYCNQPPGTTLDTFTYTLAPGGSSTTVVMSVTCADDAPVAVADAATVAEDSGATAVTVLANDTDVDGGPTSIASVTQPANGAVVITGGGTGLTYAPNANYCNQPPGTTLDTFTYTLAPGGSSTTVTMTVTCVDDNPVAVADSATVGEDSGANPIGVLANDTDVDAGPKSVASVTQPANGTVVITGGGTGLTYAPNANYCNTPPGTTLDTFSYTLAPGGSSTTVTVSVTCIDDNPVAVADAATVAEDSGASPVAVLANDTDVDGGPTSISAVTQPANGAVVITGGGTGLTYAPNANYCNQPPGTTLDTFTYTLAPGGSSTTVTMTVTCVNDAPALDLDADDSAGTTDANFAVTFTEGESAKLIEDPLDATVTDVDSANLATLTVTITNILDPGFETLSADVTGTLITANYVPGTGVLTLTGPDTVANFQTVLRKIRYNNTDNDPTATPRVINFVANDGTANSNTATSTVTVVPVDTPPTAVGDSASVNEDSSANPIAVLTNDTDPDGGPISVASVTQPANGTVVITGGGTGVSYTPNANYCNSVSGIPDTFTYTLAPGGSSASVTVTVTCVDDNPVAVADSATVNEDSGANPVAVLANDTDADGGPISITSVTQPANGAVVITGGGTGLTYAPNANYCNSVSGVPDTFTYTLTPGGSSTTVTMTVTCVDDNPVAVADSATVVEDSGATGIGVLANDTDVDAGPKSVASVTQPANGTVVITGGGTGVSYTPNANYCNQPPGTTLDVFTYTLTPGGSSTSVTVTVTCVNDPPVANPDAASITEEAPNVPAVNTVSGNVLTNDTDPDGPPLVVSAVAGGSVGAPRAGSYGSVTINSNGTYTYTLDDTNPLVNALAPGQTLVDPFGYTASDGSLTSSSTLTVTINGADDPPTPDNDAFDFIGNTELEVDRNVSTTPKVLATTPVSPVALGVLDGDTDPDGGPAITISSIVGCADVTAPFDCTIAGQGTISLQADGSFSFLPEAGDADATATFQYTLTGNPNPGTVTLTRFQRVWYVKNDQAAGGLGRSSDAFDTLIEAQTASAANEYIFVFFGNGTTSGQDAGILLKAGQHLIGQFAGLSVALPGPGTFNGVALPASISLLTQPGPTACAGNPCRPLLDDTTVGAPEGVAATDAIPTEIVGLNLAGNVNGIDLTHTAAFAGSGATSIRNVVVRSAAQEGIDVNKAGTGAFSLALDNSLVTSTGNGIDITRTNGAFTITGFANNVVTGNTAGSGIVVNGPVTFDSDTGTANLQPVSGGTTVIGQPGNGVGSGINSAGLYLNQVTGSLLFTDLDIFSEGYALFLNGTGAFTGAAGTNFELLAAAPDNTGTSTFVGTAGGAVDAQNATIDMRLASLTSSPSTFSTAGVNLVSVAGQFRAPSGSTINKSTGAASGFAVATSSASVNYAGTLTVTSGSGVTLTNNTGPVNFTGNLNLSTGANAGFTATGGSGTVTATDTNNTITTTSGTALNVNGPDIGVGGLVFRSISANGASNGIIVQDTGNTAGLTITGTGATAGSGGTIQSITNRGASFINAVNISLKNMNFTNANTADGGTCTDLSTAGCNAAIHLNGVTSVTLDTINISTTAQQAINGITVSNFTLTNSNLTGCGTSGGVEEGCIKMRELTGTSAITSSDLAFPGQDVVEIVNTAGPALNLTVNNATFRDSQSSGAGGNGLQVRSQGTANMVVNVTNSSFLRLRTNGLQATAINSASNDVDVTSNIFDPGTGTGIGMDLDADNTGTLKFNVQNNTRIYSRNGPAVNVFGDTNATIDGRISNNPDVQVKANVGSNVGSGIRVNVNKDANARVQISNNVVNVGSDDAGIDLSAIGKTTANPGGATNTLNATVTGNNVTIGATSTYGIIILSATNAADNNALCANVGTNAITRNPSSISSFRARVPSATGFFRMEGFVTNAEATWNAKGNTPTSAGGSEVSFGGSGTFAGCVAALPTNPGPN